MLLISFQPQSARPGLLVLVSNTAVERELARKGQGLQVQSTLKMDDVIGEKLSGNC